MSEIFILFSLILLNALFVLSEIALVSSRRSRLETWANKGDNNAKAALKLAENPEKFLSTVQIGITLVSILTGVYSGDKFGKYLQPFFERFTFTYDYAALISKIIIIAIVTFVSIIFGELIPKKFGLLRAEKIAKVVAAPMNFLTKVMYPFVVSLSSVTNFIFTLLGIDKASDNAVTEEEIKHMISEGSQSGSIEVGEKEIIERVFHLGDRSITSLMTHRTDIVWLDINNTVAEIKDELGDIVYSTFPACDGNIDNIKGLVYVKDMLQVGPEARLDTIVKPALFVPENNKAYKVLEKIRQTKIHTAFIVNEYGTLEGMITLNDIMEAIVGEVPQTGQEEYEMVKRDDGTYLIDAQINFYDFLAYFDRGDWLNDEERDYDTVAGFILHSLEHIPVVGEKTEWKDFRFEIMDVDGQRIDKILVTITDELRDELGDDE
jgi:putative hemolysin